MPAVFPPTPNHPVSDTSTAGGPGDRPWGPDSRLRSGLAGLVWAGWLALALMGGALVLPGGAHAQAPGTAPVAGEVEFLRGVGFAQSPGQAPRTLGRGQPVREGDRLTTAEGSTAIVKLSDGTRMTVRPGSELVVQQYRFEAGAADNSLVLQMLRGGLRTLTGLIAKGSPQAARLQTPTATVGIRGTDFDARLCRAGECSAESGRVPQAPRPNAVQASAKVATLTGEIRATSAQGEVRALVAGGSVYPGDLLETGAGTQAVLAFRDDSRVTLGAQTRMRVDNFVFDSANAADGRFLVSLLRGSMRALTGLIGRANNRNVSFATPTATVGIRGTGVDFDCSETACSLFNWLGSIEVAPNGQTALQVLLAGQGLFIGPGEIRPIPGSTLDNLIRPDAVPVNTQQLFSGTDVPDSAEGLFVFVRDGHIEVAVNGELLHLGRGEAGFSGADGQLARPNALPLFLEFDRIPLPTSRNPLLSLVFNESGVRPANICR